MKKNIHIPAILLPAIFWLALSPFPNVAQEKAAPAAEFPENLLEAQTAFDLAVMMYGDSRGNFGPCG